MDKDKRKKKAYKRTGAVLQIPKESIEKWCCKQTTKCIYGCSDYEAQSGIKCTCNYILITGRMRPPKVDGVCQEFIPITKNNPRRATEAQLDFYDKEFRAGHEARRCNMQRLQDR